MIPPLPYGLIAKAIGVVVLVAALLYAWHRFTEHYREQGRDELRPQVTSLTKQRDESRSAEKQREAETAACVALTKKQSQSIEEAATVATAAQERARDAIERARRQSAKDAALIADLRARAAAPPPAVAATCEQTMAATDAILREGARQRRAVQ